MLRERELESHSKWPHTDGGHGLVKHKGINCSLCVLMTALAEKVITAHCVCL